MSLLTHIFLIKTFGILLMWYHNPCLLSNKKFYFAASKYSPKPDLE